MKNKEISKLAQKDIEAKLVELRKELIKLNGQVATGTTLKSPGQMRSIKKTIARLEAKRK